MEHYDGRQSTSAFCASIVTADRVRDTTGKSTLTADRIPYAAGWNTMTADKVHYTTSETLRRPTEYFRILRKHRDGRQNIQSDYYRLLVKLVKSFFLFLFFHFYLSRHLRKTLLAGQSLGSLNFTLTSTSSISSSIRNLSR